MMNNWKVSILLMFIYVSCFHLWLLLSTSAIMPLGILAALLCFGICWRSHDYFANNYDRFFHNVIGLDLLIESFIPLHDGYDFYFCAVGFAIVLGLYRYYARKNHKGRCLVSCFIKERKSERSEKDLV